MQRGVSVDHLLRENSYPLFSTHQHRVRLTANVRTIPSLIDILQSNRCHRRKRYHCKRIQSMCSLFNSFKHVTTTAFVLWHLRPDKRSNIDLNSPQIQVLHCLILYKIAVPLTCELTPPGTLAGALVKKNVYLPSSAHRFASFSRSSISPRGMPQRARMYSWQWYSVHRSYQPFGTLYKGMDTYSRGLATPRTLGCHPRPLQSSSRAANPESSPPEPLQRTSAPHFPSLYCLSRQSRPSSQGYSHRTLPSSHHERTTYHRP